MDRRVARYLSRIDSVQGWFREFDAYSLDLISSIQRSRSIFGDILEIGAFHGKSAIFLGMLTHADEDLHVCDVFGLETGDEGNNLENQRSYEGLQRQRFEQNYLNWHSELPIIHHMVSDRMFDSIRQEQRFRLIHVDGGHLYPVVSSDMDNCVRRIVEGGVICFDDWRRHAGVASAVWEGASKYQISPFLLTDQKMYATVGETDQWVSELCTRFAGMPEASCYVEEVYSRPVLRLHWKSRETLPGKIMRNITPAGYYSIRRRLSRHSHG